MVRRHWWVAASAVLALVSSALLALPAQAAGVTTLNGRFADGSTYLIEVPANWNGQLALYSHGYVTPGAANPAKDVGDPLTGAYLLNQGWALAGSSYATTGWALDSAVQDQLATVALFRATYGTPTRTIAWGHSLGGMITAALVQASPQTFTGALPMCGVVGGGTAVWNSALDSGFAFQQLLGAPVSLVHITNPQGNLLSAETALATAMQTPAGRARIALAAALADIPGWFTTGAPAPASRDYGGQFAEQFKWMSQVDFPFEFAFRADLEGHAGGNPSWNTGVDYTSLFAHSVDANEVRALYKAAGLSLTADLATLNAAPRISADPAAAAWLAGHVSYTGDLGGVPVLTMHTLGDGLVVPENEHSYRGAVQQDGNQPLLRQTYVDRAGHCAFSPAETLAAFTALNQRIETGSWAQLTTPARMNAAAAAFGPPLNVVSTGNGIEPAAPAFVQDNPPQQLRPYLAGDPLPPS